MYNDKFWDNCIWLCHQDVLWYFNPVAKLTQWKRDKFSAEMEEIAWMEKFGEWKHVTRVSNWSAEGKASWEVDVAVPGEYNVELTYAGKGRVVWGVDVKKGEHIQNQQNSSHNYQKFPIGWINFPKPGRYTVSVSCLEGDLKEASLKSIHFKRVDL